MTGLEYLQNGKACGVLPVSSGEYIPTVVQGVINHETVSECRAPNAPTEELLWNKSQKM